MEPPIRSLGRETKKHLIIELDTGQTSLRQVLAAYGVTAADVAAWREELAREEPGLRPQDAVSRGGALYLCGLGIAPPWSATLETLKILRSCAAVYHEGLDEGSVAFLRALDVVPRAAGDRDPAVVAEEAAAGVRAGASVAYVTRGTPLQFGLRARSFRAEFTARGAAARVVPAVSAVDAFFALCRFPMDGRYRGMQTCSFPELVAGAPALDPAFPTVVYFPEPPAEKDAEALERRLLDLYGAGYAVEARLEAPGRYRTAPAGPLAERARNFGPSTVLAFMPRQEPFERAVQAWAPFSGPEEDAPSPRSEDFERRLEVLLEREPGLDGYARDLFREVGRVLKALETASSGGLKGRPAPSLTLFGWGLRGEEHMTLEALDALSRCDAVFFRDNGNPQARRFLALLAETVTIVNEAAGTPAAMAQIETLIKQGRRVALGQRSPVMSFGAAEISLAESLAREGGGRILMGLTSLDSLPHFLADPEMAGCAGLQMRDAAVLLDPARPVETRWPLLAYLKRKVSLSALADPLASRYPEGHPCLFLSEIADCIRIPIRDLGRIQHVMTDREILLVPPLVAVPGRGH